MNDRFQSELGTIRTDLEESKSQVQELSVTITDKVSGCVSRRSYNSVLTCRYKEID